MLQSVTEPGRQLRTDAPTKLLTHRHRLSSYQPSKSSVCRSPAHCIEYAHLIQWDAERPGEAFDADIEEHLRWVFDKAAARAAHYGIQARTRSTRTVSATRTAVALLQAYYPRQGFLMHSETDDVLVVVSLAWTEGVSRQLLHRPSLLVLTCVAAAHLGATWQLT